MINFLRKNRITKIGRSITPLIFIVTTVFVSSACRNVFEELKPIASVGLCLSKSDNKDDKIRALPMLEEFMVRGQDWLNTDSHEDVMFMANVVANVIQLKHELKGIDVQELMRMMFNSAVSSVTVDNYTFEKIPNVFPKFNPTSGDLSDTIYINIEKAMSAMKTYDMRRCEYILLELYEKTWLNGKEQSLRYSVANKLILFYLRLGLNEQAFNLMRQNKIEMDKNAILDSDYLECLFYFGVYYITSGNEAIGRSYFEAADEILQRISCDGKKIIEDYESIMSLTDGTLSDWNVYGFMASNDSVFCFLTEQERSERWKTFSDSWRIVKSDILKNFHTEESGHDLNNLLNVFQYEKFILLRSYSKVASVIYNSGHEKAIYMLSQLKSLRMKMSRSFGDEWKNLNADYQRIQKELMHHPVLSERMGNLYNVTSLPEISAVLSEDETYIDFGVINEKDEDYYFAILINNDLPEGHLIKLCDIETLHTFLDGTACKSAFEMVKRRYEDNSETLYNLLWKPIQESGLLKTNILYSPTEDLNMIMPEAISHNGKYLAESHNFHIISSCESLEDIGNKLPTVNISMEAFYDISYKADRRELIREAGKYRENLSTLQSLWCDEDYPDDFKTAFSKDCGVTPLASEADYEFLVNMAQPYNILLESHSGIQASEYAFKGLSSRKIDIIHVSTHAFCFSSETNNMEYPYLMTQSLFLENVDRSTGKLFPMFRSGLFFSGAEREWCGRNQLRGIEDGILNAEELSALDLHNVKLISLIACSTGNGEIDEFEGIIGLRRALKMAGCKSIVSTAWNIDTEAALTYVNALYENIFRSGDIRDSHIKAIHKVMERFESPYYWAPFQLID